MRALKLSAVLTLFLTIILSAGFALVETQGRFVVCEVENPVFHSNELFPAYENFYSPRVKRLREQYDLDKVVAGETDEFRRIVLLRHWIHSNMPIDDYDYTKARMETFAILEAARAGDKFNCAHFSIVQHAVLNSFGYVTRRLGVGPGEKEKGLDGHHGVNEVWVNKFSKWVLVDAKYDLHFEKEGIPLSALEIRDEVWRNGAKEVVPAFGLERKPTVPQINDRDWGVWATPEIYRWCSWETSANRFTSFPNVLSSTLVMYDDEIFQKHIWYRDGKPHWAYNTPWLLKTTRSDWIYWTPNVIFSKLNIQDAQAQGDDGQGDEGQGNDGQDEQPHNDRVHISLFSFTPNFKTFQIKIAGQDWRNCGESVELPLQKQLNRFVFRTVNLFGVTGPEHLVEIDWKK